MKLTVIKRDGTKVAFDRDRIQAAIESASTQITPQLATYARDVALALELKLQDQSEVEIAQIQCLVENELMQGPFKEIARSY
ncbi:MAG: ATP cone domain-containing protein, partial [Enterovibrio sp.]